ncbi:MAG: hypothetical protein R3A79_19470 [Nannocystaceae bacterium]
MRAPALILALSLAGCGPDYPPVIWSGEHIEYATERDRDICEGSFVLQDEFVGLLSEFVGVTLSEPALFVYVEQEKLGDFCPREWAAGCSYEYAAISTKALNRHELAHVVTRSAGWNGPASFVEGVAEMFNDGVDLDEVREPIDAVLDDFQITDTHYFTMGLFVRFLVERHGLEKLAAFMRDTDYHAARETYEATFAQHFGESLSDATAAFDDYPTCPEWSNRIALYECNLPLTPWSNGAIDVNVDLQCEDSDVFGPLEDDPMRIGSFVAFEVEVEETYSVEVNSEIAGFAGVRITRCGSCWDEVDFGVVAGEPESATLPPGRYYATFVADVSSPGQIDLHLSPMP